MQRKPIFGEGKPDVPAVTSDEIAELLRKPTLTIEELAKVLGRSRATAYNAVNAGQFPIIWVAGTRMVPTAKLREMLGIVD